MAACLEGGCRTEQSWPLWESYARSAFDGSGRIVDHSAGDWTTSEGQAYGMFFALVANDRTRFVKLLSWTEDNLAGGDFNCAAAGLELGQGSRRELEDARPESGVGCGPLDGLYAARGGAAVARAAL